MSNIQKIVIKKIKMTTPISFSNKSEGKIQTAVSFFKPDGTTTASGSGE